MPVNSIYTYTLTAGFTMTNTSDYLTLAFISAYEIQTSATQHQIITEAQAITAGSNFCSIKMFTSIALTTFKFTHILYQVTTLSFKPIFYGKVYASDLADSYVASISVPSIFSAP